LNGNFPSHFPIKNLFKITFTPCMPHSLPTMPQFFDTPVSDKQYKLWNSTKYILFLPVPLSLVQTLFSSLYSQTQPAYKLQNALPSFKSPFCMLFIPRIFLQSIV
jgi:hypothetical protein